MVTLTDKTLALLAEYNGGRKLETENDVVILCKSMLSTTIDGAVVTIDPEDAQALKDQFEEFNYGSYDEYISDTVQEALHMYLWGSTRGRMAYR